MKSVKQLEMEEIKFRNLRADELEVRVGERKNGKMTLLVYKDARVDANILDETVGQFGWACQFKEEKGTLFAGIALKSEDGTWIWKWDAGAPSNFEKEKGEASDAFKRAAFKWGIGRGLYTAPKIRVDESNATHKVSYINYDEKGRIKDLTIVDWNDSVVFNYRDGKVAPVEAEPQMDRVELLKTICGELKHQEGVDRDNLLKFYKYYESRAESFERWNEKIIRKLYRNWCERSR